MASCSAGKNHSEGDEHGLHNGNDSEESVAVAKKMLSDSPRHQEWVEIDNNGKTIHAFVVYPEQSENTSAVVMIHENKWLNDWARNMADQLAAEGTIVIAPDLLSSFSDEISKTSDFESPDDATKALSSLDQEDISSDLDAVAQYAESLDSFNGNLLSAGFCWGWAQSFRLATWDNFKASLVFYGNAPKEEEFFADIKTPVYGFYAENDNRINATIEDTETFMQDNGHSYEYEIYDDVWHAFMREADVDSDNIAANQAKTAAFDRMRTILDEFKTTEVVVNENPSQEYELLAKNESWVSWSVAFTQIWDEVTMNVSISWGTPWEHALHLHETADCSADDATSAGWHWNPLWVDHGVWWEGDHHNWDIGNMIVDENGDGTISHTTSEWCMDCEDTNKSIFGTSVIIHAGSDDGTSQPSWAAWERIACVEVL